MKQPSYAQISSIVISSISSAQIMQKSASELAVHSLVTFFRWTLSIDLKVCSEFE